MAEARELVKELLEDLEKRSLPVESNLMKAKRLARLLRDSDAQLWLDYEIKGYPKSFTFSSLGSCEKYLRSSGRITEDDKYYLTSLPKLEASCQAGKNLADLGAIKHTTPKVKNYVEAGATSQVIYDQIQAMNALKGRYENDVGLYSSLKAALHSYVTDRYFAIELGDVVEEIFEKFRYSVEKFISDCCPKAAEKLVAISENMQDGGPEARSSALSSCRRLLMDVADAIFPAQDEEWISSNGRKHKVGKNEYKNRILAFLEEKISASEIHSLLSDELEHLAARLDSLYEKMCKGVHANISISETRLAIISTYIIVAEIERIVDESK